VNKKIFILLFFSLVLVLLPIAKASAIHTYVGVQVTASSTSNTGSGGTNDNNWCLPAAINTSYYYGTRMTILGGASCAITSGGSSQSGCSTQPVVTGSGTSNPPTYNPMPICPGSATTLWSGLVDLTASTNYVIQLNTYTYCPGILDSNGYCWVVSSANQTCAQTCAYFGLIPNSSTTVCYNSNMTDATNPCGFIQALKGSPCTTCNAVASTGSNYWDASGNCYYTNAAGNATNCNALGAGITRACQCQFNGNQNNFYYAFTTPSSF
jgi:hypothetical protein